MKKVRMFLVSIVVVLLAFLYSNIDKNHYIYDRNQDTSEYVGTGIICEGDSLSQTFKINEDIFDGIKVKVTLAGQTENVDVLFRLTSISDGKIILNKKIKASEMKNGKFFEIEFTQLNSTKGKEYRLDIEESGADILNGVGFYRARPGKEGLNKKLYIKNEEFEDTLVMRTISHRFDVETFIVLLVFITYIVIFMKVLYKMFK